MKKFGRDFKLGYIDEGGRFALLAYATSTELRGHTELREVSSPATGTAKTYMADRTSWNVVHESFWGATDARHMYNGQMLTTDNLLRALWHDRRALTIRYMDYSTGGTFAVQGQAFIADMDQKAPVKGMVRFTLSLTGTGELEAMDTNNLSGTFACAYDDEVLSLMATEAPLAPVDIYYNGTKVGTWTPDGETIQDFDIGSSWDVSLLSAYNDTEEMPRISFTDASTLHIVLLATSETDSQQVTRWYVRPMWWGGVAMGDITLSATGYSDIVLPTQYKTDCDRVAVPYNPTTATVSVSTPLPQTAHCIDVTQSLVVGVEAIQTSEDSAYSVDVNLSRAIGCDLVAILHSTTGTELGRATITGGTTTATIQSAQRLTSAAQVHLLLPSLAVDVSPVYQFVKSLSSDFSQHEVFYVSDGSALQLYCPSQKMPVTVSVGGTDIYTGMMTDVVTVEGISSASGIAADRGDYIFTDASAIEAVNMSNEVYLSVVPFADVLLKETGITVNTIPALSPINVGYTTPGHTINSAAMATGARQTLTFLGGQVRTVIVSTACEQTGNAAWKILARLTDANGNNATLPAPLVLTWSNGVSVTVPANASSQTFTAQTADCSWLTPTLTFSYWAASFYNLNAVPCVDTTPARYKYYPMGKVSATGLTYADVEYTGSLLTHPDIYMVDSYTNPNSPVIFSGQRVANHLFYYNTGGSSPYPTFTLRTEAEGYVGAAFSCSAGAQGSTTSLYYIVSDTAWLSNAPYEGASPNRLTALADVLPLVRVHGNRDTYATTPIYGPVALENFRPTANKGATVKVDARVAPYLPIPSDSGAVVEFINASGESISVYDGDTLLLTGISFIGAVSGTALALRNT